MLPCWVRLATYIQAAPLRESAARAVAQAKLEELNEEIRKLDANANGGGGVKRRLEDSKFVEESREMVEGVKDAVREGEFVLLSSVRCLER